MELPTELRRAPSREVQAGRASPDWRSRVIVGRSAAGRPLPSWFCDAWRRFAKSLGDAAYPCYFGIRAFRANAIFYSYVEREGLEDLPEVLRRFLAGRDHPLANLAVFFEPVAGEDHERARARFWSVLRRLEGADLEAGTAAADPDTPLWEFTFAGVQMFVVGASPTYRRRRSRNLGPAMVLLFQPRDVFEISGADPTTDARARTAIRERLRSWDGIAPHGSLGVYGAPDNREWKQYFLPDDDRGVSGTCPLHRGPEDDVHDP